VKIRHVLQGALTVFVIAAVARAGHDVSEAIREHTRLIRANIELPACTTEGM
jgi:hypothetical protein